MSLRRKPVQDSSSSPSRARVPRGCVASYLAQCSSFHARKPLPLILGLSIPTAGLRVSSLVLIAWMRLQHADQGQEVARGRRCCSPLVDYPLYLLVLWSETLPAPYCSTWMDDAALRSLRLWALLIEGCRIEIAYS